MMISSRESSLSLTPSGTPLSSGQIPKYGTLIPNRVFVGGIAGDTSEIELRTFFNTYGPVKDCKIILDRGGISKSYGFVTFETHEDAEKVIKKESDNLIFKDRKLNVGPAIRKQQAFGKLYGESSLSPSSSLVYHQGALPTLPCTTPNASFTVYYQPPPPEHYILPTQPQQAGYPMMMMAPQHYLTHQPTGYYPTSQPGNERLFQPANAPTHWVPPQAQWRWSTQMAGGPSAMMTPSGQYVYPIHSMVPQEMVYAQMAQGPYPPINDPTGHQIIDPNSAAEYYRGVQYNSAAMC